MLSNCGGMGEGSCPSCTTIKATKEIVVKPICKIVFLGYNVDACATGVMTIILGLASLFNTLIEYKSSILNMNLFNFSGLKQTSIVYSTEYQPLNIELKELFNVTISAKMIGDSLANNYMIAAENGSLLWPKNLAYVVLGSGKDELFYSLCSTKITNATVGIIVGFDPLHDMISFFCSKEEVRLNEIHLVQRNFNAEKFLCIEVRDSAVCFLGNPDLQLSNIGVTNKTYVDSRFSDPTIEEIDICLIGSQLSDICSINKTYVD